MSKEEIAVFISKWVAEQKGLCAADINYDENIFQAGLVDSLGMFRLIFELEKEFDRVFDQTSLFCNAKPTINSLALQISLQLDKSV